MTASELSPSPAPSYTARPPTALVDASTRWPVLLMATASLKWLAVALAAGAVAFLKLHMPGFLAGWAPLTYGRLVALQDAVFIYGFASQAAMAIALWLICRLGGAPLIGRGATVIAALFWNLGVFVGALGILAGNLSPFAYFEFPHNAMPILFLSFCLYGICALLTFASRRERGMYPSLWFVLAGIVFFPWILASASMTLWAPNMRGSVTPLIAAWAGNNLVTMWLGSIALGAIYYFIPKLTGKNLYSSGVAVFGFWLYILFGQASGMHATAAFPSWVTGLSELCTILLVLPALANGLNWRETLRGSKPGADGVLNYIWWGAFFYIAGSVIAAIAAYRPVNHVLEFTLFQPGLSSIALLGFVTMSFLGAFAYILPRVAELEWARPLRMQYLLMLAGAMLVIAPFLLAGMIQGMKALDIHNDYLSVVRSGVMPGGLAIVGYLLMFAGTLSALRNYGALWCGCCCAKTSEGGTR
jgi:cytochrome c oxidase cbb3-type subunit 1